MPTYINPLALETPNGFKAQGALGGFLAGMNQDLANQMVGQSMNETNLDMATKQQALDLANATQQDKIDEANAIAAKARQDQQYADSGDYAAMRSSNDQAKKAGNDLSVIQDQVSQQLAPAKLYQQMSAELQQVAPNGLDPMNPDHVSWYDSWYKRLHQFTPNMPQMIQPNTSGIINQKGMQAQQFIQAMGTNPDFQNKMALAKQQQNASYKQATDVATITADSRRDVADARAEAQKAVQEMKGQNDKLSKQMDEADTHIIERAKKDGELTPFVMASIRRQADKEAHARLDKDIDYAFASQDDKQTMLNQATATAMENIWPGSSKGVNAAQSGGGATASPTTQPADPMAAQMKAAFGAYEPDKYSYRINPQTGKPQRKPK